VHTHVFSNRLVSEGAWQSSTNCFHHGTRLTIQILKSKLDNEMAAEFLKTSMGHRVFVEMRKFLGDS
jgi:hypothetical protein